MNIDLRLGDCIEVLKTLPDNSVDSVITDPPYGLGFMNKEWDSPEKLRALTQREEERSAERKAEGKSPTDAPFSKSVPPGLAIKGAKEGRWFQEWCEIWAAELLRVLKPGGHLISFSAPRTYHRMATAFEDAGFEIRDQIMWVFGSGFPKSLNIGKAIDKIEGNEREVVGESKRHGGGTSAMFPYEVNNDITKGNSEWEGWGTALKPAHEPMVLARKPLSEKSIAENVLKHGTGGINIDGSRIEFISDKDRQSSVPGGKVSYTNESWGQQQGLVKDLQPKRDPNNLGRFPANIIFDEEAGKLLDEQSGISKSSSHKIPKRTNNSKNILDLKTYHREATYEDKGGASRFFYCPKTSKKDRNEGLDQFDKKTNELIGQLNNSVRENGTIRTTPEPKANHHPTVKPTDLMRYLINLITPKGGTTLDPFMGSGSTGKAAIRCGVNFIGIEKEEEYMKIAKARIEHERNKPVQQKLL